MQFFYSDEYLFVICNNLLNYIYILCYHIFFTERIILAKIRAQWCWREIADKDQRRGIVNKAWRRRMSSRKVSRIFVNCADCEHRSSRRDIFDFRNNQSLAV